MKTSNIERYLGESFQNNEPRSAMEKSVPESFSEAENFSQYEDCERKSVEEPLESRECEMMITAPTTHEADKDYRCSVINLPTQTEYNVFMNGKRKNSSSSGPRRESSSTDNTTQFRFMKGVELNPHNSKEHESQSNSFNCKKQRNVCPLKTSSNTFPRDNSSYDPGDISTLDSGDISSSIARDISNSISEVESSSSKEHRNQKKQRNVCFPKVSSSYIPGDIPSPALGDILRNVPEDIPSSGSRNISSNVPEDIKSSDSRDILNSIAGDISSSSSEVESSSSKEHRNQAKSFI
ncbi:hypothetical protein CEXT_617371 [Caerostris extrusa]|uniref:Uncharacterized protein n=1 Tax=Caerostris extrusa TaxID=172846 RepID=A0AAV4X9X7_CAEEX|nr:hypothetical protein CEXT_617371 [Caerostris extrusa]